MGEDPNDKILLQALADAVNGQSRTLMSVMQGMQAEIARVCDKMDKLADRIDAAQTRLIALEQQRYGADILELRTKQEALLAKLREIEDVKIRAEGAAWVAVTFKSWAPFLLALFLAAMVYFGFKPTLPGH